MLLNGGMVYSFIFANIWDDVSVLELSKFYSEMGLVLRLIWLDGSYNLTITKTKVSTNENPMQT